ncbi:hypothetical protein T440DRAFT_514930 [Plenodomus tracheiphilus IPT5]|uniref:Uncharacterized protein n=1 Tax=Plenodomus tracheiphilus IPT5 TaxID=1408161 RepID=A0A6A7BFL7_9PLEO|nr:hypothetical protein T440DRAFT_514930 [Plenodomus tracheiphilus IPT5]
MTIADWHVIKNVPPPERCKFFLLEVWRHIPSISKNNNSPPLSQEDQKALKDLFAKGFLLDIASEKRLGRLHDLFKSTARGRPLPWKVEANSTHENEWIMVFCAAALVLEGFLEEDAEKLSGDDAWGIVAKCKMVKDTVLEQVYVGVEVGDLDKRLEEAKKWWEDEY